jgi:hypothetical protein
VRAGQCREGDGESGRRASRVCSVAAGFDDIAQYSTPPSIAPQGPFPLPPFPPIVGDYESTTAPPPAPQ